MRKLYDNPEYEIEKFNTINILTDSSTIDDGNNFGGEDFGDF